MKKLFLWISMLLLSLFTSAQVEIDGIRYYLDTQKRTAKVAPNNDDMYSGNIVIPSSIVYDSVVYKVTEMAKAFYNCEELIKIELPNSIEKIEVSAFEGCSNLISVTLPDSLKEIGGRAFFDCYKLSNIVIPEKVYYIGYSAFKACFGLTDINLPNSVKNMGTGVFGGCRNLKHIKLSENLESIRNATFSHCENIESIEIPNSVTQIEGFAFQGCSSLTSIIIPNGVFTISESVFSDCSNLRSVKLPISTQMIDDYAFHNCNNLSDVYCYAEKVPVADYGSFAYSTPINTKFNENINLHVPDSLIEQYSSTSPWRYFKSIKPLPEKEIKNIELAIKDILLEQDDTLFLTAKVFPSDIPNEFLRWESSNDSIAVVDSIGRVIAIASGTTYIIVSSDDGNEISDSCMITVEKKNTLITNITLNQTSVKLIENDTITLIATIYSTGVNDSSIIWESSNENVATINTEGQITAIAPGTATITAKANDSSGVSASCEVTVTPASYVITYLIDGEVFLTDTLTRGTAISLPKEPTKEGYTFSGWSEIPETMPSSNVTISGTFTINKYLVTFKIGDEVIASDSLEYQSAIVAPEAPEKEGYTFNGWGEVADSVPAHDLTYEGSYSVNAYVLTYVVDGEIVKSDSIAYGTAITLLKEPTKEGYTFSGWGDVPETMPAKDVTASGTFIPNKYLVTFKIGDEVVAADSLEYKSAIVAPEAPEKEGCTFNGWGVVADSVPAHDLTYEGSYSVNSYLLNYMVDGDVVLTLSVAYGATIPSLKAPEKEGYSFSGWSEAPDTMPAEDVTIEGTFTRLPSIYLTINQADNGYVKQHLVAGSVCTYTIEAAEGWKIHTVTFNGEDVTSQLTEEGTFTTPALQDDATLNIAYEKIDDGISHAQASHIKVQGHQGTISIAGATEGTDIGLYTASGTLVATATAEGDTTHLTVPTGQVYIVKVADTVVKIGM